MKPLDEAPYLDIFAPEFIADPAPAIFDARSRSCLARTAIGVLVLEHATVVSLLGDPRLRSSLLDFVRLQGLVDGPVYEGPTTSLLAMDGPDHTRLRKLVSRAFTSRSVERLRPSMHALAEELVRPCVAAGRCEFMADFADHYPIQLICELLGVPKKDHELFGRWSNDVTWVLSLELAAHRDEVAAGFEGIGSYVEAFIEERRARPQDDLVSALVQAEDGGDRLNAPELRSLIASLLFAGYDTTRNQLGIGLFLFTVFPDQWRLLGERPELATRAVEEILRFQGTVTVAPRITGERVAIGEYDVPAGTIVSLSTAAANHDPAVHTDPERFDIAATRTEPPLTFGGGPHYCLGANLARAEMQEALGVLATRMPDLRVAGEVTWRPRTGIFGPTCLPLAFGAAPALRPAGAAG
jgi:cytochrome P450